MNVITNEFLLTEQERAQVENRDLAQLQKTLGYTFKDEGLLQEALCHSSFANEHGMHKSNERLEFLGDSVLSYVVARALFKECPNAAEGELTRMRSELVRESSLYSRALTLRVPELLLHGRSMQSSTLPKSICADAVEAILGAICLDGGVEAVSEVVERLFLRESREIQAGRPALDPKSHLQALLQARGIPLPTYELLAVKGPSHMPVFHVRLRVNGIECVATGSTRKGAESAVAADMMRALAFPQAAVTKSEVAKIQSESESPASPAASSLNSATAGELESSTPVVLPNIASVEPVAVQETVTPATPVVPAKSQPSQASVAVAAHALSLDDPSQVFQDEDEPPQPSPEVLRQDLTKYASTLAQNPALRSLPSPKRQRPDKTVSEPETENVAPHPVLTESDLRRIVQMAHRGGE